MSDFLSHLDLDILEAEIVSEGDLEQYGVKGMKWGVRRSQAQLDRAAGRKQKRAARKKNRAKKMAKIKKPVKKGIKILSDVMKGVGLGVPMGSDAVLAITALYYGGGALYFGGHKLKDYVSNTVGKQSFNFAFKKTKQWVQTDPSRILNELQYIIPDADRVFDITDIKK